MPKENDTSAVISDNPVEVQKNPEIEAPVEEAKGLSLRDALEVAIETHKTPAVDAKPQEKAPEPTAKEEAPEVKTEAVQPKLEPPAEYTPEEKADFMALSRKGQEAQLRLDRSRKSKIDEIKSASSEYREMKALADAMTPFIKATGIKDPAEVALKKALSMWKEFEEGDPKTAAAAYLRAKGIEVPQELLNTNGEAKKIADPRVDDLQKTTNALIQEITSAKQAQVQAILSQAWTAFEQEKNAAGAPKYPDINTSESGLRLASNIGSLVCGTTDLSRQFIAQVKSRIPDLSFPKLLEEAYRFSGGKIADIAPAKTQATQQELKRSSRAASSVPGRGSGSISGPVKKFKTYREAAEAALKDIREAEGS